MNGLFTFIFSIWIGYMVFLHLSHPQKRKHKLPKISVWNMDILPNFRFHLNKKTYHIHHWFILALITTFILLFYEGFQYIQILGGLGFGGVLQGLTYPDRFKFRQQRIARNARYPYPGIYKRVRNVYFKLQLLVQKIY